jgi:disulfide bond formation protein DsbB
MPILTMPLSNLTLIGNVIIVLFALLMIKSVFWEKARNLKRKMLGLAPKYAVPFAFTVALISTLGSLYFSEIANFVPCELCWFQRIFMYPQVILFGIALFKKDKGVFSYALPLSIIGACIAGYNYWLQMSGSVSTTCSAGVSCATAPFFSYGFITIAYMALTGFLLIILAGITAKGNKTQDHPNS